MRVSAYSMYIHDEGVWLLVCVFVGLIVCVCVG